MTRIRIETGAAGATPAQRLLARVLGAVILAGLFVLAFVFFWVAVAVVGLTLLAAPVIAWWQRRRLERRRAKTVDPGLREPDPLTGERPTVIDAEFTTPRDDG